jgi:hypothetical protein
MRSTKAIWRISRTKEGLTEQRSHVSYDVDMPYIVQEQRPKLDAHIDALANKIALIAHDYTDETAYAGLLNYAITRLVMQVIDKRFGKVRYGVIATVSGVLKNVADEFYRRVVAPYEEKQITKNGDVDLYATYTAKIAKL